MLNIDEIMNSFKLAASVCRIATRLFVKRVSYNVLENSKFSSSLMSKNYSTLLNYPILNSKSTLLSNPDIINISNEINSRSVTKFSIRTGKRKPVVAVLRRFYRLHWGGWIRTIAGRHRRLFVKGYKRRERLKNHVFCNATQCTLLDKMVGHKWRKPKYFVDDPYEPYHTREEFPLTAQKPRPYFPPEDEENISN